MAEYMKKWLSVDEQVVKLKARGVEVGTCESFRGLLRAVAYYRLTGYLYPFRESQPFLDDAGRNERCPRSPKREQSWLDPCLSAVLFRLVESVFHGIPTVLRLCGSRNDQLCLILRLGLVFRVG